MGHLPQPLFQSEAKYDDIDTTMIFYSKAMQ